MIDEDRTMQLFGYTSDELTKGSHKKIVAVCEECGTYRCVQKREYSDLCFACGRTGENHPGWKEKVVKTCEVCGKEFSVTAVRVAKGRGRFCSRDCYRKGYSENMRGENSHSWKGGEVIKICKVCGKEFSVKACDVAKGRGRFCSHKCQGKWQSEARCGENNPLFGTTLSLETRKRQSATLQGISYDEWESFATNSPYCPKFNEACRESNREKYDRRCFLSDVTEADNGQKLSVHHYDMNKAQGCDGHTWKLVPLCRKLHSTSHTSLWTARIQYLLNHVWVV